MWQQQHNFQSHCWEHRPHSSLFFFFFFSGTQKSPFRHASCFSFFFFSFSSPPARFSGRLFIFFALPARTLPSCHPASVATGSVNMQSRCIAVADCQRQRKLLNVRAPTRPCRCLWQLNMCKETKETNKKRQNKKNNTIDNNNRKKKPDQNKNVSLRPISNDQLFLLSSNVLGDCGTSRIF